jgi:toxin ParE1/3/4
MKHYEVRFQPRARADLLALYNYIADAAGTGVAEAYIARIEAACLSLRTFPERGTRREHIRPGLRTMGFERRATIAFIVETETVVIVRIFYGGQNFERALAEEPPV